MTSNGYLKKAIILTGVIAGCFIFSSCSNDQVIEEVAETSLRLILNVGIGGYQDGNTRSEVHEWKNGDRIYFLLQGEDRKVSVRAVYDAELSEWKVSNDGTFPSGNYTGTGVFIDGETQEWGDGLTLGPGIAIYRDENVGCEKTNTHVKITALLRPILGRLRFSNPTPRAFAVSGIEHCYKMNFSDLRFETSETPVECSVENNGYSRYVYGSMPTTSRAISIAYDNQLYTATFGERILDPGCSGYIELPSESSHSGWDFIILSIPELGPLDAFDVGVCSMTLSSSIVNNGNGTVTECGFCYSRSPAPTVNDAKVSYGRPSGGSFTKTITGLEENTPYHIRAYAINESGVAYSSEKIVSTLAIGLPALSVTTVKVDDGATEAAFSAQLVSDSNGAVTECGFCYSINAMPDISDTKVKCEVAPTFGCEVGSLNVGTRYYVRAYAINAKGVGYGEQTSFIGGGGKPTDDDLPRPNMIKKKH